MKNAKTIYEILSDYSKNDIDSVLSDLNDEEKEIIHKKYGDDLNNPINTLETTDPAYKKFYGSILPKLKRLLEKQRINAPEEVIKQVPNEEFTLGLDTELLKLISEGYSNIAICRKLGISSSDLHRELLNFKNNGLNIFRKYYYDGKIKYQKATSFYEIKVFDNDKNNNIIIPDSINDIKLLLISDLHIGNSLQRIDLINQSFDYCKANGINVIICCGDFLDGTFSRGNQYISNPCKQIECFMNSYPRDPSIFTFGVGGDHDLSILNQYGIDITQICNNFRHDINIAGFGNSVIQLKRSKIQLYHFYRGCKLYKSSAAIILHGHSHKFKINTNLDNQMNVCVPSLSNIMCEAPSALEMSLSFKDNEISNVIIKQIGFLPKPVTLGEFEYLLSPEEIKQL